MDLPYSVVVAGSGFAGSVTARRLAEDGFRVLVLEKRDHIGGNAYDFVDVDTGLTVHKYGPHIFHTNHAEVFRFLSRFTAWNGYEHTVLANVHGSFLPVPFNFNALEMAFGAERAAVLEQKLLQHFEGDAVSILELIKATDRDLSMLGEYVYKNIFETYTVKQWGKPPESIDPATTARVPVRLSRDDRYFTDRYQGLPADGYTSLFERMLDHENITVQCNTDALDVISLKSDVLRFEGEIFEGDFVYTGEAETLLDGVYGFLPYRTLDFSFETHDKEYFQPCGTVNYTVDELFTRITEFKHMTGERSSRTVILKEYPMAYTPHSDNIPYYPIANDDSMALYETYRAALSKIRGLHLVGRLAEYKYYNMDAVCARAFAVAEAISASREV